LRCPRRQPRIGLKIKRISSHHQTRLCREHPGVPLTIYTIGHSTRAAEEFRDLLRESEIRRLVDVRQYPGSRRLPQFNRAALESSMAAAGIAYEWIRELGGRRRAAAEPSPNPGLRNPSFRNYADYMPTPAFRAGIERLLAGAQETRTAIMCAEAVYWRCHRRLISDYLTAIGCNVQHIMGPGQLQPHTLTPGVLLREDGVLYPGGDDPGQPGLWP